jgi:hypothetical protein
MKNEKRRLAESEQQFPIVQLPVARPSSERQIVNE